MEIELKQTQFIRLSLLEPNDGQVEGLPKNPRKISADDLERLKNSITKHPDFLALRELVVYPHGGKYVVLGGNMRLRAMRQLKFKEAPCKVVPEGTTVEDLKTFAALDNGSFGSWDYDALANEWDDLPLVDLGIPAWEPEQDWQKNGLSSEGREGAEGYDEFVDKFEQKLTTDDCYTPPAVYDIIRDFVDREVAPLKGREIVRPFVPGGDYERYNYPENCVVLDNPPFSLYSKIVRFYLEKGIDFFLFGPSLTLFHANADVCFVVANVPIKYENGALVSTGFVTNMVPDIRIWVEHTMRDAVIELQDDAASMDSYEIPVEVMTSARLGFIASRGVDLKIKKEQCQYASNLDGMKELGKHLYGSGYLLSAGAAKQAAKALEVAAERKPTIKIELSKREREIVDALDRAAQP